MEHQEICVPAYWKELGTLEWDNKQLLFLQKKKVLWTLDWDTKQLLFLHTGKYYGHFNGTPSDICFCTLESIGDAIMGHQSIGVPAH